MAKMQVKSPSQVTRTVAGGSGQRSQAVALIAIVGLLLAVQIVRRKGKWSSGQQRGAVFAAAILLLFVAALADFSPGLAVSFSALLLVVVLAAGPDATGYLFKTLPSSIIGAAQ